MIEVKCPNCDKKAILIGVKELELVKGKRKISGWKKFYLRLSELNLNDTNEVNQHSVVITFHNLKEYKIPLREYLDKQHGKKVKWVSCLECGNSKPIIVDKIIYYYSISIGNRFLVAGNRTEFIKIHQGLKNRDRVHYPEFGLIGYPKIFWKSRDEVLEKMEKRLQ